MQLPPIPSIELIAQRLPDIFPEGTEYRNYVIREMAARTVFVMFYVGAIAGTDRWLRPSQVTDMSDEQAVLTDETDRLAWIKLSLSNKKDRPVRPWYAVNSREPVRDETLRNGFIACRAVLEREGVATTSSKPKYALEQGFAKLFDSNLTGELLINVISAWRDTHLSKTALARQLLVKQGATITKNSVTVTFPNGEIRKLAPGPSSVIAKSVIEVFAPRFLKEPAVLWLSESGNKVVARDESLAKTLGFKIDPSKALPDIILVDLGQDMGGTEMLVVFTEVVASDGPVNRERKLNLTKIAIEAGFDSSQLAFLTAFMDRSSSEFKKSIPELAWGSYAWFVSEPDHIIDLQDGNPRMLCDRKADG